MIPNDHKEYIILSILDLLLHHSRSSCSNEEDVISDLEAIYDVGTFVQITELHDVGDKMRMIIQGHRRLVTLVILTLTITLTPMQLRIRITGLVEVEVADSKQVEKRKDRSSGKRWSRRLGFGSDRAKRDEDSEAGVEEESVSEKEAGSTEKLAIMTVRTENLLHHPFEQTQELKVRRWSNSVRVTC